jgi:hypothetical protein
MTQVSCATLNLFARRAASEAFAIESAPAFFAAHDGARTAGFASVVVTRSSIAIRFEAPGGLNVPKAGYGESSGKILAQDGSWRVDNVNDAGRTADGCCLFGAMELITRSASDPVAITRLVIAGASWSGEGTFLDQPVVACALSHEVVSHHDRRMAIAMASAIDPRDVENLGRACSFVSGIDVEVLRVEHLSADGAVIEVRHLRGYRRVGRGPHSPFTGIADEHRMRAWIALAATFPHLLKDGVPIDIIVDEISAHNQVAQINVSAQLLLLATTTAAYHSSHGLEVDGGASSRRPELAALNGKLNLGLSDKDLARFERLRVELLDTGFFHKPGYETGRPQQDIKFIRDISHAVVLRLCGYEGPFYGAEKFTVRDQVRKVE